MVSGARRSARCGASFQDQSNAADSRTPGHNKISTGKKNNWGVTASCILAFTEGPSLPQRETRKEVWLWTSAGAGVTKGGGEGANVLDPNMFFPWLTVPE